MIVCPKTGRACELTGCLGCWSTGIQESWVSSVEAAYQRGYDAGRGSAASIERDAARYRWLRDVALHVRYTYWLDAAKTLHAGDGNLTGSQLDAGIDREMAMTARCDAGGGSSE